MHQYIFNKFNCLLLDTFISNASLTFPIILDTFISHIL